MNNNNAPLATNASIGTVATCALALLVWAMPAWAADPIFPAGSRIGLIPPTGMVASETFAGFADPNKDAAILITALPPEAYLQMQKTLDPEVLKKQGVTMEKREPIKLGFGNGLLFTGHQVADKARYRKWLLLAAAADLTALVTVQIPEPDSAYPDGAVRAALASLALRPSVPESEELGLLPFTIGDRAGFHVDGVLRGRAVMLSDPPRYRVDQSVGGPLDVGPDGRMLIAAVPGGPTETADFGNFARLSFNEVGGIKDVHITVSERLRITGQSGYQTMAEAKDARTGTDVMVVQWLRFGGAGYLQIVGVGRTDVWPKTLARLRAVRDSIELK